MTKRQIIKHLKMLYPNSTIVIKEDYAIWDPKYTTIKVEIKCYMDAGLYINSFSPEFKTLEDLVQDINKKLIEKNKELISTIKLKDNSTKLKNLR